MLSLVQFFLTFKVNLILKSLEGELINIRITRELQSSDDELNLGFLMIQNHLKNRMIQNLYND
jgi:hypothetical protein